jgi:hypothetical protein
MLHAKIKTFSLAGVIQPLRRQWVTWLLGLLSVCASSPAVLAGDRTVVPISQHRLLNGDVRFTVPVRIGNGRVIEAMLDTGSFGLRVMSRALASSQYEPTGIVRSYGYGNGVVLRGPLARATVAIGNATSRGPINIQVVQSVGCRPSRPRCPASRVSAEDYGIGGDGLPHAGYDAIVGVSMRFSRAPGAATNPLVALGDERWIVVLPKPGTSKSGELIVNPTPSDIAGFNRVSLRRLPGGESGFGQVMDSRIPNCPERPLEQQARCQTMALDSGARGGVAPFYTYAVLYDEARGSLSVKRRN